MKMGDESRGSIIFLFAKLVIHSPKDKVNNGVLYGVVSCRNLAVWYEFKGWYTM